MAVLEWQETARADLLAIIDYSRDNKSTKHAFAKLKALLPQVGERTRNGLWNTVAQEPSGSSALTTAAICSGVQDIQPDWARL